MDRPHPLPSRRAFTLGGAALLGAALAGPLAGPLTGRARAAAPPPGEWADV
ncbi:hypothetical protein G3I70_03030, partial [Actinomadura bangladeshensis]|nr:hypothetical protein [Actinomadura bangladeshensis]